MSPKFKHQFSNILIISNGIKTSRSSTAKHTINLAAAKYHLKSSTKFLIFWSLVSSCSIDRINHLDFPILNFLPWHCSQGGEKYICRGILFKFAMDYSGLYGGDDHAAKAAGHDLNGLMYYRNTNIEGLHFPLMVLSLLLSPSRLWLISVAFDW